MTFRIHQRSYESKADYYCRVSQHVVQEGAARASEVSRLLSGHEVRSTPAGKRPWREGHNEILAEKAEKQKRMDAFYEKDWNGRLLSKRKAVLANPECTSLQREALEIQRELQIYPGGLLNAMDDMFSCDVEFPTADPRRWKVLKVEPNVLSIYESLAVDDLVKLLREDGGLGNKCARVTAKGFELCRKALYDASNITEKDVRMLRAVREEIPGLMRQVKFIDIELERRFTVYMDEKDERHYREMAEMDRKFAKERASICWPCVIF